MRSEPSTRSTDSAASGPVALGPIGLAACVLVTVGFVVAHRAGTAGAAAALGVAVLVLAGWVWTIRLAPDSGPAGRWTLAGGLALVLAMGAGIVAAALPSGTTFGAVASVVAAAGGTGAVAARPRTVGGRRFRPAGLAGPAAALGGWGRPLWLVGAVAAVVVTVGAGAVVRHVTLGAARAEDTVARTSVGLVADPESVVDAGLGRPAWTSAYDVEITNREGRTVTYEVEIVAPAEPPRTERVTVAGGAVERLRIELAQAGGLRVRVFGGSETAEGFREVRVGVR